MVTRGGKVRKFAAKHKQKGINLKNELNFQQGNIDTYWNFKAYAEGTKAPKITGKHTKNVKQRTGYTQAQRDAGYGSTYDVFTFYSPADKAKQAGYSTEHQKKGSFYMWKYFDYNNQRHKYGDKNLYKQISSSHKTPALEAALGKLDIAKDAIKTYNANPFDASTVKSPIRKGRMAAVLLDNQSKGITTPNVSKGGKAYNQFAAIDKDTYTWESGALEVIKGTGETYIGNYIEHDNFNNPQPVRKLTPAEKADIFDAGRDDHLVGLGMSLGMIEGKTNKDILKTYNEKQSKQKSDIKELSKLKLKLAHAYRNRIAPGHKEKLQKIKDEIKLKFPGVSVYGDATTVSKNINIEIDSKSVTVSNTKKKQDAMNLYIAKDKINELDKRRGVATGLQNKATQKVIDKAKSDAAQKEYDNLWADGGTALLSDTSNNNIQSLGQTNFNNIATTTTTGKSFEEKVGILKKYDSWDQRRKYIAPALDKRKADLNRYYSSNYLQDFTVSDKDASQSMFGIDTPTGHSLAYSSMTEIGINQKTPRTAIKSINEILSKTNTDRQEYAENLSGIETKLLTLNEQRELKRKQNKAVEADIARQVEADVSGGTVSVNTEFRDKITGTSEELYDLNVQVAEHNTLKSYYSKSISQTDEDVEHLKDRLVDVTKVKNRNDYETIISSGGDDGGNKSKSSLGGYYKANKFRRSTGTNINNNRGGRRNNLSGLVL